MHAHPPTVVIENLSPLIDGGQYPVKRAVGEDLVVEADIYKDGHDVVAAVLKWRKQGEARWHETPMLPLGNSSDRWRATCSLFANSPYEYTIEAWGDTFRSWQHEFAAKFKAGQDDLKSETLEGALFIEKAAQRAAAQKQTGDAGRLTKLAAQLRESTPAEANEISHYGELEALMSAYADRSESTEFVLTGPSVALLVAEKSAAAQPTPAKSGKSKGKPAPKILAPPEPALAVLPAPTYPRITVDRERALFSQWYEFFPLRGRPRRIAARPSATACRRIDDARAMGFDVIYFPPIHPDRQHRAQGGFVQRRRPASPASLACPGQPSATATRNARNGGGIQGRRQLPKLRHRSLISRGALSAKAHQRRHGNRPRLPLLVDQLLARSRCMSTIIPSGFTSARTAQLNTRRIRRRNIRTSIR